MYLLNLLDDYKGQDCVIYLHSTMYLLNQEVWEWSIVLIINLHSTMYLLNRAQFAAFSSSASVFTFHYVSIKSVSLVRPPYMMLDLHSTMYLLNRVPYWGPCTTDQDLHSTMYLLNRCHTEGARCTWCNLHSTMYLLNPTARSIQRHTT